MPGKCSTCSTCGKSGGQFPTLQAGKQADLSQKILPDVPVMPHVLLDRQNSGHFQHDWKGLPEHSAFSLARLPASQHLSANGTRRQGSVVETQALSFREQLHHECRVIPRNRSLRQ